MRPHMRKALLLVLAFTVSSLNAEILKVGIDGVINPVTAEFIEKAVNQAETQNAEFLLIDLSTPGGLGVSMQQIIQKILNSRVPVVCYVTPKGAHAASAGFFILLSADVAAMAPGTNTGAAHPVLTFGGESKTMMEKVKNDALANLRSIVNQRQRNYAMAEQAVTESKSYTAEEALKGNLINFVADDQQALLKKLDGFEVTRFTGEKQKLETTGQKVVPLEMTFREKVLSTIADPNIALVLGVLGLLGVYVEFTHPGFFLPGILGAIAVLLALLGFSLLPINIVGVLLILLAIGLFIAEVKVQGFGILGIGGVVAMLFGILMLINAPNPSVRIGLGLAAAVAIGFGLIFMFLLHLVIRSHRRQVTTGSAGLIGQQGIARSDIDAQGGMVFVNGEWWKAVSDQPISKGSLIRVVRTLHLQLVVEEPSKGAGGKGEDERVERL